MKTGLAITGGLVAGSMLLTGCESGGEQPSRAPSAEASRTLGSGSLEACRINNDDIFSNGEADTVFPGVLKFSQPPDGDPRHLLLLRPVLRLNSEGGVKAVGFPIEVTGQETKLRFSRVPKGSEWRSVQNPVQKVPEAEVGCSYDQPRGYVNVVTRTGRVKIGGEQVSSYLLKYGETGEPPSLDIPRGLGAFAMWVQGPNDNLRFSVMPQVNVKSM